MAVVAIPLALGLTGAVFASSSSVSGNTFGTATLLPPSGISATAACGTITFLASNTAVSATGAVTITKPAGVAAGDVLVAEYAIAANGATVATPAGWTLIRSDDNAGNLLKQFAYFHVAGAAEPANYTFTGSVGVRAAGGIAAYQNVASVAVVNAQGGQTNASSTNIIAPSITTGVANTRLVGLYSIALNTAIAAPAGMTRRWNVASGTTLQIAIADVAFGARGQRREDGDCRDGGLQHRRADRAAAGARGEPDLDGDALGVRHRLLAGSDAGCRSQRHLPGEPRTTVAYSDTGMSNTTTYTYRLTAVDQNWTSTTIASGSVTTC